MVMSTAFRESLIQERPPLALSLGAMSSAEDYEWADDWYDSIGQAYCLTLAEGLTPAQFLDRIGAVPAGTSEGLEAIGARSQELREQDPVSRAIIGVTEVRDAGGSPWALGVEVN